ncbi:hypothetical protein [Flavobacterium caeni]|uniref:hypothetical protein n=1 Tax=Flavobacterium caeni TaxID=490189 RepID=UPI000B875C4A|nr:hypothetical protein [Flavobacterium caeni]
MTNQNLFEVDHGRRIPQRRMRQFAVPPAGLDVLDIKRREFALFEFERRGFGAGLDYYRCAVSFVG